MITVSCHYIEHSGLVLKFAGLALKIKDVPSKEKLFHLTILKHWPPVAG
jgi:hypothetical protein